MSDPVPDAWSATTVLVSAAAPSRRSTGVIYRLPELFQAIFDQASDISI
jgi:hypothetical protein